MPSRPLIALAAAALLAAVAGGWAWQRAAGHAEAVRPHIPAKPDLGEAVPALRERLAAADSRARSTWRARAGLAELAQLYHANGFLAEALHVYAGLRELEPAEPRWPHLQATIHAGYGQADEAVALERRTLELAPDYLPARLRLGDLLLKMNQAAEATAAYEDILRREPANPYALLGLARLDFEAGRLDDARRRLEQVVAATNYHLGYDLIVTVYERLGLADRARAIRAVAKASGAYRDPADPWLDELIDHSYDPYRLALAAGTIARDGKLVEARALLERAIELAPDDVSARFQLGTLALEQGDATTAREQLRRCTELAPGFADGWARLSDLQARQGDGLAAERTLAEGLRRCPDSPGLHLMNARRLRDAGRTGEAITAFQASIRLRPNEADAYLELGTYYIRLGREAEGVQQVRLALEAEPGHPGALGILAFHAISSGNEPAARHWMDRVLDQPRMPRAQVEQLRAAFRQRFGNP